MKAAIILCGGQSRRMGTSKAWLAFGNETCLQRGVRILIPLVERVVVVSAWDQPLPTLPADVRIVYDAIPGEGPLRGLQAGLLEIADPRSLAFVTACDSPFLSPALVGHLFQAIGHSDAIVPRVGEQSHPLTAVYRLQVLSRVEALLAAKRFAMKGLLDLCECAYVEKDELRKFDPELRSLWNLNTPEEYAEAQRLLASGAAYRGR